MKNPIKIIHKFKNNNLRIQYKVYIFIGSLIDENIMKILKIIENKDFISSILALSDKQIKEISNYYGENWYEKFFLSYHINNQINIVYPKGNALYVITKIHNDKKYFKIGYTKDLNKRLKVYNTIFPYKIFYNYYIQCYFYDYYY